MKLGIFLYKSNPTEGGVATYTTDILRGFLDSIQFGDELLIFTSYQNHNFFEGNFKHQAVKLINLDEQMRTHFLANKIMVMENLLNKFFILPFADQLYRFLFKIIYGRIFKFIDDSEIEFLYIPQSFPVLLKKCATIVSMHDILHVIYPDFFSWRERRQRELIFGLVVQSGALLQASSEYIKKQFQDYFKLGDDRVFVIRDGLNIKYKQDISSFQISQVKEKYKLENKFIFYPAQHWPHKNHLLLLKALERLFSEIDFKVELVLTGGISDQHKYLYDYVERSKYKDRVKFIGNVISDDLPVLYRASELVVMPSLYESNSLVVMEAMALGCKVIASDIEPNKEINNDCFVIFAKDDKDDLAEKINNALRHPENFDDMIQNGLKIASGFSWQETALNYFSIIKNYIK